jgi:peptide/nickel transport system permease protein
MTAMAQAGRGLVRDLLRNPVAAASALLLIAFAALAAMAPLFEIWLGHTAQDVDLLGRFAPPSADYPLGQDEIGRDVFLRLLYGARVSLVTGLAAAVASAVIGTVIGLVAGYRGGWIDDLLMRFTDSVIALPLLPLLIVLAAVDLSKLGLGELEGSSNALRLVVIISLVSWTTVARLVRGAALSLRERTFVTAAHALGVGGIRVAATHILPNVTGPIVVATTLAVGNVILFESVLSFLGLGIQPPLASWGNMLTAAQNLVWQAPMLAVYPGLAIFLTVLACNLLGDGLQDILDPRTELD